MKLSVIIPVYNAEKYLQKCLQSLVEQDLSSGDFEVVLINDGSKDNSLQIAESFNDKIKNLKIFSQDNQGEAISRNCALKIANGDFITFLDSDDYYENNTLKNILDIVERNQLDILYLKIVQVDEAGNFLQDFPDLGAENTVLPGLRHERRPFPATVYRKKIIGDIKFPLGIIVGPDSVFNALVQSKVQRVSYTNKAVYNYTFRQDSLSKKGKTDDAFKGFLKAITTLSEFHTLNFGKENKDAQKYFSKMVAIFTTRIIELNILPKLNEKNYNLLIQTLEQENYSHILADFSTQYPYIDKSFAKFKMYQKYLNFKSKIYNLIHNA